MKKWIIEVTAVADPEDLDRDDVDENGNCAIDGSYRLHTDGDLAHADDPREAALDVFHATVPISCLEDYDILIRVETEHDAGDSWLRKDLGCHSSVPGPALPEL